LHGAAKLTIKSTLLGLRLRRVIHAPIHLNALIAKAFIRPTLTTVLSGNTTSTRSSLQKNMPKFRKPGKI